MSETSNPADGAGDAVSIDPRAFRSAAGNFLTGITIATTTGPDGEPRGITANSFTTVSLEPPLVLFCVGRTSRSFAAFEGAKAFAVNVLSTGQRQLSSTFGSKAEDKFAGIEWVKGLSGSPIFPDSLASFDCVLHDKVEAGDHIMLIGRVISITRAAGTPLGYFGGNYIDFDMQRDVVDASGAPGSRYGGLFRYGDDILFLEKDGKLHLPFAPTLGEENREQGSLLGELVSLGIDARLSFVYSVFSDGRGEGLTTVYLGEIGNVARRDGAGFKLIPQDSIPFERVSQFGGLIQRYIREQSENEFGLYVGTSIKGTVHRAR
jgi:flavin reductase (DIM6/NTAB) family NADH-FMN oxidoreductase RutF